MSYQCSLDETPWTPCRSPLNVASDREGDHTLLVRGVDPEGNVDPTPASITWIVDLNPPATVITSVPRSPTAQRVARVSFVGYAPIALSAFQCRVDGHRWRRCASPFATGPLAPGRHVISIRAIDQAGNVEPIPCAGHGRHRARQGCPPCSARRPAERAMSAQPSRCAVQVTPVSVQFVPNAVGPLRESWPEAVVPDS